jgi:hypothetical protein
MPRRSLLRLVGVAALALLALSFVGAAGASPPQTCSGTFDSPGSLAGSYPGNVVVSGACSGDEPATVNGNLTLKPGSALIDFAGLTVNGNVIVQAGATLFVGAEEEEAAAPQQPSGDFHFGGNLVASKPLGVVLHGVAVDGNINESGGGGGFTCDPIGVFALFESPVFSVVEGGHVGGKVTITNLTSCWLGITHSQIEGGVNLQNNQLADPDAIEVLDNSIGGNIVCQGNSMMWDSADLVEDSLFPRLWEPNTVGGNRIGQCVVAPPIDSPSGVSPGPF